MVESPSRRQRERHNSAQAGGQGKRMPRWTWHKAMMVMLFCTVLFRMGPATAGAIGTSTTVKPLSWTAVSELPRDGEGREARETQDMSILLFITGVVFGLGLGLLGYRVLQGRRVRQARQRNIDQLTEQFQALFREIDSGKNPYA
jgi:hypothetical protein